jgi:hypothetical protein
MLILPLLTVKGPHQLLPPLSNGEEGLLLFRLWRKAEGEVFFEEKGYKARSLLAVRSLFS